MKKSLFRLRWWALFYFLLKVMCDLGHLKQLFSILSVLGFTCNVLLNCGRYFIAVYVSPVYSLYAGW
jgi:hypothetical protein